MKLLFLFMISFCFSLDASLCNWWKNREAVQLYKNKNYDESLAVYNDLIDQEPYNSIYNYNIGDVLYRQGRYQDAFQAFKRAADHAGKNINLAEYATYGAGNSSYQQKEWQQAIDMYEATLALNSNNEHARHNLRLAQEKLAEQKLQDMKDQLQKDKEKNQQNQQNQQNQEQDAGQDQDDQQGQSGDESQDSQGSESQDQSSGDDSQGDQQGKPEQSGKGQKSKNQKVILKHKNYYHNFIKI